MEDRTEPVIDEAVQQMVWERLVSPGQRNLLVRTMRKIKDEGLSPPEQKQEPPPKKRIRGVRQMVE